MIVLLDRITHDRITYDRVSCTSNHDRFSNGVTHDRLTLDRVTRTLRVVLSTCFSNFFQSADIGNADISETPDSSIRNNEFNDIRFCKLQ